MKINSTSISSNHLNEYVIRLNALNTVILCAVGMWIKLEFIFYFLLIDFALRGFFSKSSILSSFAQLLVKILKLGVKPVFAAPKRFAARIGAFFSLLIGIFLTIDWSIFSLIVGTLFIICAVLEAFFNLCVGCYIYDWFVAPITNKKNDKSKTI